MSRERERERESVFVCERGFRKRECNKGERERERVKDGEVRAMKGGRVGKVWFPRRCPLLDPVNGFVYLCL